MFILRLIQGLNPDRIERHFFAQYNKNVTWPNDPKSALGEDRFLFGNKLKEIAP